MDLLDCAKGAWRLDRSVAHYAVGGWRITIQSILLLTAARELEKKPAGQRPAGLTLVASAVSGS
jgi:hypothetical protein